MKQMPAVNIKHLISGETDMNRDEFIGFDVTVYAEIPTKDGELVSFVEDRGIMVRFGTKEVFFGLEDKICFRMVQPKKQVIFNHDLIDNVEEKSDDNDLTNDPQTDKRVETQKTSKVASLIISRE